LTYARLNDLTHITAGLEAAMAALQQNVGAPQSGQ